MKLFQNSNKYFNRVKLYSWPIPFLTLIDFNLVLKFIYKKMKIMNILNLKKISQLILNNYNSPINFYFVYWFKFIVGILYLWKLLSRILAI